MKFDKRYLNFCYVTKRIYMDLISRIMILVNFHSSIFSYRLLSKNVNDFNPRIYYKEKHHYGHYKILKKIHLIDSKVNIDHGAAYFDDTLESDRFLDYQKLVVSSEFRAKVILGEVVKKPGCNLKEIYSVGPYINYVNNHISNAKFNKLKALLNKTLLVFPSHSYEFNTSDEYGKIFFKKIREYSQDFDTVIVCMYWRDIQLKRDLKFKSQGYKIVTAGHRADPRFLSRLKTIISLSDYSISNAVGSHIGYCVSLGVCHEIIITPDELKKLPKGARAIHDVFKFKVDKILPNQLELVNKYWGVNEKKIFKI